MMSVISIPTRVRFWVPLHNLTAVYNISESFRNYTDSLHFSYIVYLEIRNLHVRHAGTDYPLV